MRIHVLETDLWVPRSRDEIFAFFADASNLQELTPGFLDFRIVTDEQPLGPYLLWVHEHRFVEEGGGTRVRDRVQYAVPGGALVNRLFVRRDVERIFAYRTEKLRERFGG